MTHPFICSWTLSALMQNFFTQHKMAVIDLKECGARRSAHAHHTSPSELFKQVLKLAHHDKPWRTSWRIIDLKSSQRSASEELMPASHETSFALTRTWMRWDLNDFEHNCLFAAIGNWRSQRNRVKLWIVEGLYKYCFYWIFFLWIFFFKKVDFLFHLIIKYFL